MKKQTRTKTSDLDKLIDYAQIFVCLWENHGQFSDQVVKNLIVELIKICRKHPMFPRLKKQMGRKTRKGGDTADLSLETKLANECLAHHYEINKRWLEQPMIENFVSLQAIMDLVIRHRCSLEKKLPGTSLSHKDKFKNKYSEDFNYLKWLSRQPTSESRAKQKRIRKLNNDWKMCQRFIDRLHQMNKSVDPEFKQQVNDFRHLLKTDFERNSEKYLKQEEESKSVYSMAKKLKIDFRMLLYLLRKLNFPLENSQYRQGNIIHGRDISLFNNMTPKIRLLIKMRNNKSDWIKLIHKEYGWDKSYISTFMKRRIQSNYLPKHFWEACPPEGNINLLNKIKGRYNLKEVFEKAGLIFTDGKELEMGLKQIIQKSKETLLIKFSP